MRTGSAHGLVCRFEIIAVIVVVGVVVVDSAAAGIHLENPSPTRARGKRQPSRE